MAPCSRLDDGFVPKDWDVEDQRTGRWETGETAIGTACLPVIRSLRPKRISFNKSVTVYKTLHKNNYSKDELHSTWYNECEYKKIQDDIRMTLEMMRSYEVSGIDDNQLYCMRGLEDKTEMGLHCKRQIRESARDTVLLGQGILGAKNKLIPESLAFAYMDHSRYCRIAAHQMALVDEAMALR